MVDVVSALLAGLPATEPAATAEPHWLGETGREVWLALAIGPVLG